MYKSVKSLIKLYVILTTILLLVCFFISCSGRIDYNIEDTITEWDKYFSDEVPEIYNSLWIDEEDNYNSRFIAGIIGVDDSIEGEFHIKIRLFTTLPWGGGFGLTSEKVKIFQNDKAFECIGGKGLPFKKDEFVFFHGFPPLTIDKNIYENLDMNDEQNIFLLNPVLYETDLPITINKWRFEEIFISPSAKLSTNQNALLISSYKLGKDNLGNSVYKIEKDVDDSQKQELLNILAEINDPFFGIVNFNYKEKYILAYSNYDSSFKKQIQDVLYEVGHFPYIEFTIYFSKESVDGSVDFDLYAPFDLIEDCSNGCLLFENVWVDPVVSH